MTFFAFSFDSKEAWTSSMLLCKPNVQMFSYNSFGGGQRIYIPKKDKQREQKPERNSSDSVTHQESTATHRMQIQKQLATAVVIYTYTFKNQ